MQGIAKLIQIVSKQHIIVTYRNGDQPFGKTMCKFKRVYLS